MENHPEYQNRDARVKVMDTQGLETVFMLPDARLRRRGSAQARHRGDDGHGARVQPVARRGLGLRPSRRPDHRGADDLARRPRQGRRGGRVRARRAAPRWCRCGPRRCPAWSSRVRWATRSTTRCGPGWPRPACRWRSTSSDSGYLAIAALWGGKATFEGFGKKDPLDQVLLDDRAIHDTMASMIVHQVFTRHPKLKVASIENGSYFVYRLDQAAQEGRQHRAGHFTEDPVEQLQEQRLDRAVLRGGPCKLLADTIGVDKILFGSDWPHGEGLADPDGVHRRHPAVPRVQRRGHPEGHARQRLGPARCQGRSAA